MEQTVDPQSYQLLTDVLGPVVCPVPGASWPATATRPDAVAIEYSAGFGTPEEGSRTNHDRGLDDCREPVRETGIAWRGRGSRDTDHSGASRKLSADGDLMGAGARRDQIVVERRSAGDGTYGAAPGAWATLLETSAEVLETRGREGIAAGIVRGARTATVRLLRSPRTDGITEDDRIRARNTVWNIASIARLEHDRPILELQIEEERLR